MRPLRSVWMRGVVRPLLSLSVWVWMQGVVRPLLSLCVWVWMQGVVHPLLSEGLAGHPLLSFVGCEGRITIK